jgi:hypothetical protein
MKDESTREPICGVSSGEGMFKLLLISIVIVPVLLGMQAATSRSARRGLFLLLSLLITFDALYLLLLYCLRVRWVDWASGAG